MPQSAMSAENETQLKPGTTSELIESIVKTERLNLSPAPYGAYFSPHFSAIREHYLRQGKFRDFVRFVVDLGLLARKDDREFIESIKNNDENIVIRYGEASLHCLTSNKMKLDEIYESFSGEPEFLQDNVLDSVDAYDVDDLSLELAARLLRCNKKYRVCFVPHSEFAHILTIYPFIIELIYAIAEDLDKDATLFDTMVNYYTSAVLRYHEEGNYSAFYAIRDATISYLKQKNVQLIFAVGVLDIFRWKVHLFDKELSMYDLPGFVDELDRGNRGNRGKDFILIDRSE